MKSRLKKINIKHLILLTLFFIFATEVYRLRNPRYATPDEMFLKDNRDKIISVAPTSFYSFVFNEECSRIGSSIALKHINNLVVEHDVDFTNAIKIVRTTYNRTLDENELFWEEMRNKLPPKHFVYNVFCGENETKWAGFIVLDRNGKLLLNETYLNLE